ncbi:MAG: hypothetical protein R3277_07680 [Brumimicrobium sp.]|nr:hypothetical protein [Brumimicrobium sp.]
MKSNNIKSLNSAVYVMRHFVELSAKLLPHYERITRSEPHSLEKLEEKKKIEAVFQMYELNPKTSEFLLGSNIIDLITKAYENLKNRSSINEKKALQYLNEFKSEYQKLRNDWYITLMN